MTNTETLNIHDQMIYWLDQMQIANKAENMNLFSEALNKYKLLSETQLREIRGVVEPTKQTEKKQIYTFEPNQYVKCIDNASRGYGNPRLEKGMVYKVKQMTTCIVCKTEDVVLICPTDGIEHHICGCGNYIPVNAFRADRFVPCELMVTHSDISMFTPLRDIERSKNEHCLSIVR